MLGTVTRTNHYANCNGRNHSDSGEIVVHDRCGAEVVKREDGKVFEIVYCGTYSARKFLCWTPQHVCDPIMVRFTERENAKRFAEGKIEKGALVRVARGRKVPIDTIGTVFWTGVDNYGKDKVGIRVEGQSEPAWTAASNCEIIGTPESTLTEEELKVCEEHDAKMVKEDRKVAIMQEIEVLRDKIHDLREELAAL